MVKGKPLYQKGTGFILLLLLGFMAAFFGMTLQSVSAQDYEFRIPKDMVIFWVEPDGTVSISYDFTIQNTGKPLDYIDIGAPNNDFDLANVIASINNRTVNSRNISRVDYQETGIAYGITIDNTAQPIPRNQQASIYVELQGIRDVLYVSSEKKDGQDYVSFQFSPAYFSPDFTIGNTAMTVRLVLPKGLSEQDAVYYNPKNWQGQDQPESWITAEGNVVYEWQADNANSRTEYIFGAMFPRSALPADLKIQSEDQARSKSSSGSSFSGFIGPLIMAIFFAAFFLRKRKGKNSNQRMTKSSYLPPKIKAEGEGIKRGLTSIEAGILLEQPMDKIISMIVFSLVKKKAIEVKNEKPFEINVEKPLPENLYDYELGFLEAMESRNDAGKKAKMQKVMTALILNVSEKMKGFSLEETKAYYRDIIAKAWQQVQEADTPELKGERLDDIFGWIILDNEVEKKTEETFSGTPVFLPGWWWRTMPYDRRPYPSRAPLPTPASFPASGSPAQPTAMPTLPGADFARSITDSVRNFSEGVVGEVKSFTNSVTRVTNPVVTRSGSNNRSSGSGRSGGMSCACACACAGCACACAGGGGGR